jgi:RNA polymerase sigma-70 factor (ECF subfamily)
VGNSKTVPDGQILSEQLYRVHYDRVVRLCRLWLNDPYEAEEAAQEVFLKLVQADKGRDQSFVWEAWLTRVAVNVCRDRRRSGWWKWWRGKTIEVEQVNVLCGSPTPEEETVSREARERVWRSFDKLSARQQEVFALRYVEGWSTEEVAAMLGLTPGSVKRHLFRAVHSLRKALGGPT